MPDISRGKPLVDSVNSVARMSYVRLRLCHRVALSGQASDDCNARAMKAEMRQSDSSEELMPFFSRVFWELHEMLALPPLRKVEQMQQVVMKRGRVHTAAFREKHYRSSLRIDVGEGNHSLRKKASSQQSRIH
jgi:hypothetical protein